MRDFDHKRGRQLVDCTTEEDTVTEESAAGNTLIYITYARYFHAVLIIRYSAIMM